jgi:hypothetical protein
VAVVLAYAMYVPLDQTKYAAVSLETGEISIITNTFTGTCPALHKDKNFFNRIYINFEVFWPVNSKV